MVVRSLSYCTQTAEVGHFTKATSEKAEKNRTVVEYSFGANSTRTKNDSIVFVNESYTSTYDLRENIYSGNAVSKSFQTNESINDVSVLLLRGAAVDFYDTQDDPWFTAHQEYLLDNSTDLVKPGHAKYRMDHFLNVLVCDERIQFCNQITRQCTQLHDLSNSSNDLITTLENPLITDDMNGVSDMISSMTPAKINTVTSHIYNSIQGRDHAALQTIKCFNNGQQYCLDPEQWKAES